jgi:hypothetical protein
MIPLSRLIGVFQIAAWAAILVIMPFRPGFAADPVTATVAHFGLVKDKEIGTKEAPNSPSGLSGIVADYVFLAETVDIDACPGTVFGVEHRLNRRVNEGEEPLYLRYEYPRQTTPDGRVFTNHNMALDPGGTDVYVGFTFEYPWEMVSGDWTFRLMQGKRELAATTFKVKVGACLVS